VTKPNPDNCRNCLSKCAYDCAQLQYTIQHRTGSDNLHSYTEITIIAQILSIGEGSVLLTSANVLLSLTETWHY